MSQFKDPSSQSKHTRFEKIEKENLIELPNGKKALSVGLHIVHEVTSAQAFDALRKMKLKVKRPQNTFAVTDHVVNTGGSSSKSDVMDEIMIKTLEENCREFGIVHYGSHNEKQGICHVVAPETGLTLPNITIFCGDSHTSTHGAFGTIAAGIGTSNVRDILATGCLLNYTSPKQLKIEVNGKLDPHLSAKDLTLYLFSKLGNQWGTGGAVYYCGDTIKNLSMEQRMTLCNMTIEMGGRFGYCDVDETTIDWYRQNRDFWGTDHLTDETIERWLSYNCDEGAHFDKSVAIKAEEVKQMVSFGLTLNDIISIDGSYKKVQNVASEREKYEVGDGTKMNEISINGAFIGSCTNGRLSDFLAAADIIKKHGGKVKVKNALAVPGSMSIKHRLEEMKIDKVFTDAGFEWRNPGCSSCLAMNPDKFVGRVASSTNRNFPGRQGPESRTFLMSPASVALSALEGKISNVKDFLLAKEKQ